MDLNFKINGKTLETERLLLRAFNQSDLNDFFEYASVPGVGEMAGWHHHTNINETQEILNKFIQEDHTFAIVYKDNNKVIGSVGVRALHEDEQAEFPKLQGREIGYALSKDYWGKGIMPEAVKEIIRHLFNELSFDFLLCGYMDKNNRSRRVQEKCGFKNHKRIQYTTQIGTVEPSTVNIIFNKK